MKETPAVSVAIITLNEADRLAACIESVAFADDIVVVDSGSRDGTPDIAATLGCRVYHRGFDGFAAQKQFAVDCCRHDWVLILDADERLPVSSAEQIKPRLASAGQDIVAFGVLRRNYLHGRWIRRCGWWPDRVVRLVRRQRGAFSDSKVHERWIADGRVVQLSLCIDHYSFRDYAEMLEKLQRYSTLGAEEMAIGGKTVAPWSPLLHGGWTFFSNYFLKLGFLSGFDGLIISLLNAGGSLMKYAKCREIVCHRGVTVPPRRDGER